MSKANVCYVAHIVLKTAFLKEWTKTLKEMLRALVGNFQMINLSCSQKDGTSHIEKMAQIYFQKKTLTCSIFM